MQSVTTKWLFERGGLHDARVRSVRKSGTTAEIVLDDEWANERGLGLPDRTAPGTLIVAQAVVRQGDLGTVEGGWISEVELSDGELRLAFTDRDLLVLSTTSVTWARAV